VRKDVIWAAVQWPGLEYVIAVSGADGVRADSQLVMAEEGPARVSYQLECDTGWRFRALSVSVNGEHRADLESCTDIDINVSPLTNTLPIRRLDWADGQAADLDVAYVSVPELTVESVHQRYTMLATGVFRYESGSFRTELPVDEDGFVLDYPGIWTRRV
jgi:hypothetical protein